MAVQRLTKKSPALANFSTEDRAVGEYVGPCFSAHIRSRAVAREMPTDVVQAILGHASLQTTFIYVRAERRHMLEAGARYYAENEE